MGSCAPWLSTLAPFPEIAGSSSTPPLPQGPHIVVPVPCVACAARSSPSFAPVQSSSCALPVKPVSLSVTTTKAFPSSAQCRSPSWKRRSCAALWPTTPSLQNSPRAPSIAIAFELRSEPSTIATATIRGVSFRDLLSKRQACHVHLLQDREPRDPHTQRL